MMNVRTLLFLAVCLGSDSGGDGFGEEKEAQKIHQLTSSVRKFFLEGETIGLTAVMNATRMHDSLSLKSVSSTRSIKVHNTLDDRLRTNERAGGPSSVEREIRYPRAVGGRRDDDDDTSFLTHRLTKHAVSLPPLLKKSAFCGACVILASPPPFFLYETPIFFLHFFEPVLFLYPSPTATAETRRQKNECLTYIRTQCDD